MSLFIVSDLHARSDRDPTLRRVLNVLKMKAVPGDIFVFAGDIFDLFVGEKKIFLDQTRVFWDELKQASDRGVHIHYIEGNHDFHLRQLAKNCGFSCHSESIDFELDGKRFYIAHGDLVDRKDYGYLLLRWIFRSWVLQLFVKMAPCSWIEKIGFKFTDKNRILSVGEFKPKEKYRPAIKRLYRNFAVDKIKAGYDFVVLGHCHDLDEAKFVYQEREGTYFNVGFPPIDRTMLLWDQGTKIKKIDLSDWPAS